MQYSILMTRAEGQDSPSSPDPDLPLVTAMVRGDTAALEELYQRWGPRLLAYLHARLGDGGLAEEVLQDVMLAAWRSAARFRGAGRMVAWLLAIARNRAINAYHRQVRPEAAVETSETFDAEWLERTAFGQPTPPGEADPQDPALYTALLGLPAVQRETLELIFFHGLSQEETAQVLGVLAGTVKSRLHRAKASLRDWLQKEDEAHG